MTHEEHLAARNARLAMEAEATAAARAQRQANREAREANPYVPPVINPPARAMRRIPPRMLPEGHPLLDGPPPMPQRPLAPITAVEHRLARKKATERNKAARIAALKAQLKELGE